MRPNNVSHYIVINPVTQKAVLSSRIVGFEGLVKCLIISLIILNSTTGLISLSMDVFKMFCSQLVKFKN